MKKLKFCSIIIFFSLYISAEPAIFYTILDDSSIEARFQLDGNADQIWELLTDYANSDKIMPNVEKTTILSHIKNITIVETTVKSGIFSMTYSATMTENKAEYILSWKQKKGPFSRNSGRWKLTPKTKDKTDVIYTVSLDHILMPNGIKEKLVKSSIPELYNSLQHHLQLQKKN